MYLGNNVKDYEEIAEEIIDLAIKEGHIRCDICTLELKRHLKYERRIKETGQKIEIIFVNCNNCNKGHALLPDFLLPYKQYSAGEIEGVIIDSAYGLPVNQIETEASESTVKRWITQIPERIERAINILKYLFIQMCCVISEILIDTEPGYAQLEQLLDMAPHTAKHSGNKLGLANIWLGKYSRTVYV